MTDLATAQDRLEAAIVQLEKALDARVQKAEATAQSGADKDAASEAISRRLDEAIARLQALLGD